MPEPVCREPGQTGKLVALHCRRPTISENPYAVAVHGGAGAVAGRDYAETEAHLEALVRECAARLAAGDNALDIVEHAVAEMESSGLYVAGRGSAPNSAGYVELDASIMHGPSRRAGAVAAVRDVANPVLVARGVMEKTPHVMLAGHGAFHFAEKNGFEVISDPGRHYVLPVGVEAHEVTQQKHGTVGAVALDQSGSLAAATSTGGTFAKLEGRVGDTPLIGPGTWADDHVAISATGTGEHIIRSGGAVSIAYLVRTGASLAEAIDAMLAEVQRLGGDAGIIATSATGEVVMTYNSEGMKRAAAGSAVPLISTTFA